MVLSYVEHLLTRDAEQVDGGRDSARLRRYLEAFGLNTAGIVEDRTIFEAAGINRKTALAYERLLVNLLVVEAVPAWTSNRLKRLVLSPKRYVVDPGLAGAVLGLDVDHVPRCADLDAVELSPTLRTNRTRLVGPYVVDARGMVQVGTSG